MMNLWGWGMAIAFSMATIDWVLGAKIPISTPSTSSLSLEEQSTGQYYYAGYILLRKAGHSAIGIDGRRSQLACFRGFVEGDRIVNATRVLPPYQPDSRWESETGMMVDLSRYQQVGQPDEDQLRALQKCVDVFSR